MKKNSKTTATTAEDVGLGPKKTLLVIVTVVGCVAILFPKIFYPMLMNSEPAIKERPADLLRQERPVHANPNEMYAALKERGRSIPPHPLTVPIIERPRGGLPPSVNIERRPGAPAVIGLPGPGMRAAAFQAQAQANQKSSNSTSVIMPIYTFGIVAFFVFTIVKILMKNKEKEKPQKPIVSDPVFCEKVFKASQPKDPKDKKLAEKPCNGCNGPTKEPKEIVKSGHELELEHRFNHLKEHLNKAVEVENDEHSDRKSIYLEGELSNDSKILVSATETETSMEKLSHITGDDSTLEEDESIILSGKMTISLISLNQYEDEDKAVSHSHPASNVA
ncbi:unnamed protein product [Diamesa hyperborea]